YNCQRRRLRRNNRKRQRPPWRGSSAQKVIAADRLAIATFPLCAPEPHSERGHPQEINNNNDKIDRMDSHLAGQGNTGTPACALLLAQCPLAYVIPGSVFAY